MDVRSQLQPWCLNPAQSEVSARPHCADVSLVGRQTQRSIITEIRAILYLFQYQTEVQSKVKT